MYNCVKQLYMRYKNIIYFYKTMHHYKIVPYFTRPYCLYESWLQMYKSDLIYIYEKTHVSMNFEKFCRFIFKYSMT